MTPVNNIYVLYHTNCMDGNAAAYAAWKKFGDESGVHYIAVNYTDPVPAMVDGSEVYILDFSFNRQVILALKKRMNSVVVVDHHKTAEAELSGIEGCVFDMEHSGAVLSWKYFHGEKEMPYILNVIQDRDLWQFQYPDSKAISSALRVAIKDFRQLDQYKSKKSVDKLALTGIAQEDYIASMVDNIIKTKCIVTTDGVAFGNVGVLISEVGNGLCKLPGVVYSMTYFITDDAKVVFSLRSIGEMDVSTIAVVHGGGGHKNAAGFVMDLDEHCVAYLNEFYKNRKEVR